MAVRIKDWMIPYTWWIGIEITDNHVINVLFRAMNNLIMVNEDRELYVDLQLPDWIQPDDDFPVGVTTGKILEEDWWEMNAIILNWKTTSWDYVRLIYWVDWNLYYDPGTGEWIKLATYSMIENLVLDTNTKTFFLTWNTWADNIAQAQAAVDWFLDWKEPIISFDNKIFLLSAAVWDPLTQLQFFSKIATTSSGYNVTYIWQRVWQINVSGWTVTSISFDALSRVWSFLDTETNYNTAYTPQYPWSPATKKYVDDWLALKQDILTPWTRITIDQNNVISADITGVFIYKWNVTDPSALPSSWQTVGDCWISESDDLMYAWDGTQWNQIWWTSIDLSPYFNKNTDTSDNITQWTQKLFVNQTEKSYWNAKQDALTAGDNIDITNNVISAIVPVYTGGTAIDITNNIISNEKPFDPENAGTLAQVLKKTSTGYRWSDEVVWFDPENAGTTGQVLKKTSTGYHWADESWWGWGGWGWGQTYTWWSGITITPSNVINNTKPFDPAGSWTNGQVLTKTTAGYTWADPTNVMSWSVETGESISSSVLEEIVRWLMANNDNGAILKDATTRDTYIYQSKTTDDDDVIFKFIGTKFNSERYVSQNWDYTVGWENCITITVDTSSEPFAYSYTVGHNDDEDTERNYISVEWAGYQYPYMPTQPYQPATKQYVDQVAAGTVSTPAITNNTSGTTTTLQQERAWTQAEYNALWGYTNWVIYNIIGS